MKDWFSKVFAYDGKLLEVMNKFGQLVLLTLIFLVCCVPVVTIGPAISSLYYAVIKSIRRDRGSPLNEYFYSFKRTLLKGTIITITLLAIGFALYSGYSSAVGLATEAGRVLATVYVVVGALTVISGVYIFPVLSRFEMKIMQMWQLAFVMGIRFFHFTVLLVVLTCLIGWLQIYILPIPCILFVPGLWCFLVTFVMEKALLHYMPKPKEGEDAWYYGSDKSKKSDDDNIETEKR